MKENSSSRAIWSPHDEKAFCTSCVEQLDAGYICPRKGLPEECLENLAEKMFSKTAKKYTHKQLKNKWNALKKLYDLWRKRDDKKLVKRQTRGASNAYKNVVNGPPENLDQLMRMFDQSYASATCGEELVEDDLTICTDAVAEMRHSSSLDENSIINTLEDSHEFATCGEELDEENSIINTLEDSHEFATCGEELDEERCALQEQVQILQKELAYANEKIKERCALQEQVQILQKELAYANEKIKLSDVIASEAVARYEEQKEKIKVFEERLAQADRLRKIQHNTIIELKGNIRVFCRVRPHLVENCSDEPFISYPTSVEFAGRGIDVTYQGKKYSFSYDKVFDHEATQENVFDEISQLVQSAVDGYKVCIFAYGQTGSGKTFTMIGNPENDKKGIIPRSIEEIFTKIQSQQELNCSVHASISEIYCNEIRDLLAPGGPRSSSVSDLTEIEVLGEEDATKLLNKALRSRSVARTNMNELSSRSHFVFSLKIFRSNEKTSQQVVGALNLIDLAGSERNEKSGSTGQTLNEATAINKSLTSLSRAIDSVARGARHIPVRDTKLTMLLEPYLGGGSKTLMVVNIAPEASSIGETISSLRFASGVSVCNIGVPRHQIQQAATKQVCHSWATIVSPSSLLPPNSKRKLTGMRSVLKYPASGTRKDQNEN